MILMHLLATCSEYKFREVHNLKELREVINEIKQTLNEYSDTKNTETT
jgi:hypothetical protein